MSDQKNKPQLRRLICFILMAVFTLTWSFDAIAKPESFDSLVRTAAKAYERSDFDVALSKFEEAYALKAEAALLYNMGRACEGKADFANAVVYYTRFISSPNVEHTSRVDAVERIKTLNEVIAIQGGGPAVAARPVAAATRPAAAATRPVSAASAARPAMASPSQGGCIDVNTANETELTKLKSIGPSKAKGIIDSRNAEGPFRSIDELDRVKGIGAKTINGFRDAVCPIGGANLAPAPVAVPQAVQGANQMPQPQAKPHNKANDGQRSLDKGTTAVIEI